MAPAPPAPDRGLKTELSAVAAVKIPELRDIRDTMDARRGMMPCSGRRIRRFVVAGLLLAAFSLGWFGGGSVNTDE